MPERCYARLGVAPKGCLEARIPVIDHMWQTETGGPIFGNPYGHCEGLPLDKKLCC